MRPAILQLIDRLSRQLGGASPPDDSDLLARAVRERDDAAFAAIVDRHGRLVWSVCRGSLPNDAEAEDAFQATFVALFRGAAKVRRQGSLAPWLHGAATRIAKNARRLAARRNRRERRAARPESVPPAEADETWEELHVAVHEEIARLSAVLRDAFVLCVLEGLRHEDAAARLGVPAGTLSARVSRAKSKLLARLRSRGLAPAAITATACVTPSALAAVPESVRLLTLRRATEGFAAVPRSILSLAASAAGGLSMSVRLLLAALIVGTLTPLAGNIWFATAREKQPPPPSEATAKSESVAAPDLVRKARENQAWATKAKTLRLRFEGKRTQRQEPKELAESVEIAFDETHLYRRFEWKDFYNEVRVWDGKGATIRTRHAGGDADGFVLASGRDPVASDFLDHTFWLWNQPHAFWWTPTDDDPKRRKELEEQRGRPEDFVLTGREVYRGIPCYVLHRKEWHLTRWYVGEKSGLLHGLMSGSLPGHPEADRLAAKVAAAHGKELKTEEQFYEWIDQLGYEKGNPIALTYFERRHPTDRPQMEMCLLDYREVKPGRWFPMEQTWTNYKGDHDKPVVEARTEIRAAEVAVDETLPATLFDRPALTEGARVDDQTTDPPLIYLHKKDRTPAEWAAMRAAATRDRQAEEKARVARDALIGTPAPPLPKGEWINGPALSWADLKGKKVVLVFWSESCGPSLGYVPILRKMDAKSPIVVVGVHAPGSAKADIERVLKLVAVDGPVCIDPPSEVGKSWGSLFMHFRMSGMPSAVLIDGEGKLAAHGEAAELLRKAAEIKELRKDR